MFNKYSTAFISSLVLIALRAVAGPYAPAAGQAGSTAVWMNDSAFIAWASGWTNYVVGLECDPEWQNPEDALGAADGNSYEVVSLGRGGEITMIFDEPIEDGPGNDLAVFENSPNHTFLELAYCEVSSDGEHFVRFPNHSLTPGPVDAFEYIDPTDLKGLAGKYIQGYGTPFDLADLDDPLLDKENVRYIRLVDIVGDGTYLDSYAGPIYDPYPTVGSAGFDLDAVGVLSNDTHEVSIEAVSDFAEWGDRAGEFMVTRKSWDLSQPLSIAVELSGAAENGVDYEHAAATITISAGRDSAIMSLISIPDSLIEGEEDVVATLSESDDYILGGSGSAALTLSDSPLADWKREHFSDAADNPSAADDADPDGDGITNLLEYALDNDPNVKDGRPIRIETRFEDGRMYMDVIFFGNRNAPDVELYLLRSADLNPGSDWVNEGSGKDQADGSSKVALPVGSDFDSASFFRLGVRRL